MPSSCVSAERPEPGHSPAVDVGKALLLREVGDKVDTSAVPHDLRVRRQRGHGATDYSVDSLRSNRNVFFTVSLVMCRRTRSVCMKPGIRVTTAIFFFRVSTLIHAIRRLIQWRDSSQISWPREAPATQSRPRVLPCRRRRCRR